MTAPRRIALVFCQSQANSTLSYHHGWPRAFAQSRLFEVTPINLAGRRWSDRLAIAQTAVTGRFDAIVFLHSAFSNAQELRGPLLWLFAQIRAPKAYFIGNEYKLMPEKMRFCRTLGVSLLVTQSNDPRVLALYREALGCEVACIPNTGCDLDLFRPTTDLAARPIDLGYRAFDAPLYLGNNEKAAIAEFFEGVAARYSLRTDISLDPKSRFDAPGYAAFLNRCRGQIGTESGGDFFELTDATRKKVNAYLDAHPTAGWPELERLFFAGYGPSIPMRIISGRQVEAAACKTVQVLFEGRYNDFFQPDVHYIPLRKDFANIDDVVAKLRDDRYCRRVTDAAFEVVQAELTYDRLVEKFAAALFGLA